MPRAELMLLGYLLIMIPIGWLTTLPGSIGYTVSVLSFKFSWTFTLPFILAALQSHDRSTKFIVTVCVVVAAGISLGALLSGQLLQAGAPLSLVFVIGFAIMLISAVLMLRAEMGRQSSTF
jgi:predicted MFS family arabinose efflux permease